MTTIPAMPGHVLRHFDQNQLTQYLTEGTVLGENLGAIYFGETAPPEYTPDVRYSNRVIQILDEGGLASTASSEVFVVVGGSTQPIKLETSKQRRIQVVQGAMRVLLQRADMTAIEDRIFFPPHVSGGESSGVDLYEGDSYAVVRPLFGPSIMAAYHDCSAGPYEPTDEVRSETLAPHLDRILAQMGYDPDFAVAGQAA